MRTNYPKKIRQIIKESPMSYSALILVHYKNGSVGASELFKRWQRDKKSIINDVSQIK